MAEPGLTINSLEGRHRSVRVEQTSARIRRPISPAVAIGGFASLSTRNSGRFVSFQIYCRSSVFQ